MPILDQQRRLRELGRIHCGYRDGRSIKKLDKPRLTSSSKQLLEQAAEVYGGEVVPWDDGKVKGRWQLFTDAERLNIAVAPDIEPISQWYELWSGGGCQRRCDGFRTTEDDPCICRVEAKVGPSDPMPPQLRKCKPTTRMSILLPDIPDLGVWRLESRGWNASVELPGMLDTIAAAKQQGIFLTGSLRIEARSSTSGGQTRQYVVPVIELDVQLGNLLGDGAVSRIEIGPGTKVHPGADVSPEEQAQWDDPQKELEAGAVIEGEVVPEGDTIPEGEEEPPAIEGSDPPPVEDAPTEDAPADTPAPAPSPDPPTEEGGGKPISTARRRRLFAASKELGVDSEDVRAICHMKLGVRIRDLTTDRIDDLEHQVDLFARGGEKAKEKLRAWVTENES